MWKYLRRKLGLDVIRERQLNILDKQAYLQCRLEGIASNLEVHNGMMLKALAQIISTVNPNYHKPEIEPTAGASQKVKDDWAERKAESDRIGQEALNRMHAEQAATDKHNRRI